MPNTGPILRVLTTEIPSDAFITKVEHVPGSYTCPCDRCRAEVFAAIKRGVRRIAPLPVKRAA